MKKFLPFLGAGDQALLLHYPELWIMRIHYVFVIGLITTVLAGLAGLELPIGSRNHDSDQNWLPYFFGLLFATFLASLYWSWLQIRQRQRLPFGGSWQGSTAIFLYFACLLVLNAPAFVFLWVHEMKIVYALVGMTQEQISSAFGKYSHAYRIIAYARGLREYNPGLLHPVFLSFCALVLLQIALLLRLFRSIALASVCRALAVISVLSLLIGFAIALLRFNLETDLAIVFFIAYILSFILMIRGTRERALSALTSDATVVWNFITPFVPLLFFTIDGSLPEREFSSAIVTGVVLYLVISPIVQALLNRYRALPT